MAKPSYWEWAVLLVLLFVCWYWLRGSPHPLGR